MTNLVLSSGHYLDIDAYASCLAYRELLHRLDVNAKATTTASTNASVPKLITDLPLRFDDYTPTERDSFVLLDVSDPKFFDKLVDHNRIVEVIDHHPGFEKYWAERLGDKAEIIKIGAVATQIYERFLQANKQDALTPELCKLLIAAIIDNTLNLKAGTTTPRDLTALEDLMSIGKVDKSWVNEYLEACEASILTDLEAAIKRDTKTFMSTSLPNKLGQVAVLNHELVLEQFDIIKNAFNGNDDWALSVLSLENGMGYFVTDSPVAKKKFETIFDKKFDGNILTLDKFMLRKELLHLTSGHI